MDECIIENCSKERMKCGKKKDGSYYFSKYCGVHHKEHYGMLSGRKHSLRGLDRGECTICGWKGPCDCHRIIPGIDGGKYENQNIVVICPNCHRLVHEGLIKI